MHKREFLRTLGSASLGAIFAPLAPLGPKMLARYAEMPNEELAQQDAFWTSLRGKYRLTPDYINLENGYYSMQSEPVLEAFVDHVRTVNYQASRYMRTRQEDDKVKLRTRLAKVAGASVDEVIVTRNTTESLDTVIAGYDWKPGDEAVMSSQDYGAMLDMFKLQARRYGMVNRVVSLPLDPRSDDEIVQIYANAITPRTRLLMVCHMVNITGHILPVRAICDMAHSRGVDVMVDGAHAFAQLSFAVPDLGCDYYGASLHKWLGTPLGLGLLYVRKDKIANLWPIFGDEGLAETDIRKLNHTGTHPVHTNLAIDNAIDFHESIGVARKEARLRYLQQYWTKQVHALPKIRMNTPSDPKRCCAIANVGIEGMRPADVARQLMERYKVWTVGIDNAAAGVHGVRVTPQLYTTTAELDVLVRGLKELSA